VSRHVTRPHLMPVWRVRASAPAKRRGTRHLCERARASAAGYTCAAYLGQRNALMHVPRGRCRAKDPLFAAGPSLRVVKWRCSNSLSRWITPASRLRFQISPDARRCAEMRGEHRVTYNEANAMFPSESFAFLRDLRDNRYPRQFPAFYAILRARAQ